MTGFDRAVKIVLTHEGGYSNNPRPWRRNRTRHHRPRGQENGYHGTMRELPHDHRQEYLPGKVLGRRAHCDAYPWPLCLYVFDSSVNQGPSAAEDAQASLDTVQDGGCQAPHQTTGPGQ